MVACAPNNQPTADAPSAAAPRVSPEQVPRIAPAEAHRLVLAGQALLVCAYDDDEKYQRNKLEGSISFGELQRRLPTLGRDQEIILYCS
jgi:hypothetical protein